MANILIPNFRSAARSFPTSRYMSYSTFLINNGKLYQIDTLNDISMISKTGVNPFTTGPTGSKAGTYELFVTPKGDQGKANELKYLDEGKSSSWRPASL